MLNSKSSYTHSSVGVLGYLFGLAYAAVIVTAYSTTYHHVTFDITPPKERSDWIQISKLLVHILEEPSTQTISSKAAINFPWMSLQRCRTQQNIYKQLVQTARTMQDMKYTILIAKEKQEYGSGKVIGMIEFGVSMIHGRNSTATQSSYNHSSNFDQNLQRRLLMIGMICIDQEYRKKGIASALIRQCETIALQQWKETELYAHIEATNHKAIKCFSKLGYTDKIDDTPSRIDYIGVRRRNKIEYVPHLLFMKKL